MVPAPAELHFTGLSAQAAPAVGAEGTPLALATGFRGPSPSVPCLGICTRQGTDWPLWEGNALTSSQQAGAAGSRCIDWSQDLSLLGLGQWEAVGPV